MDAIDSTGLSDEDIADLRARADAARARTRDGVTVGAIFFAEGPFGKMRWKVSDLKADAVGAYACSAKDAPYYAETNGRRFQYLSVWASFSADEIRAGLAGGQ